MLEKEREDRGPNELDRFVGEGNGEEIIILAAIFKCLLYQGHLTRDFITSKFDALRQNDYLHLTN